MIQDYSNTNYLDLRGTPCPINYVRCCLALEELLPDNILHVDLDKGEPEKMVIQGLRDAGHNVDIVENKNGWLRLLVVCGGS